MKTKSYFLTQFGLECEPKCILFHLAPCTCDDRLTRRRVIENSADALPWTSLRDIPANMRVTAKQIRYKEDEKSKSRIEKESQILEPRTRKGRILRMKNKK